MIYKHYEDFVNQYSISINPLTRDLDCNASGHVFPLFNATDKRMGFIWLKQKLETLNCFLLLPKLQANNPVSEFSVTLFYSTVIGYELITSTHIGVVSAFLSLTMLDFSLWLPWALLSYRFSDVYH